MVHLRRSLVLGVLALLFAPLAAGALVVGGVAGTVVDLDHLPIGGARIDLSGLPVRFTDGQGRFAFTNVPVGEHSLSVARSGFESLEYPSVLVSAGRMLDIEVVLHGDTGPRFETTSGVVVKEVSNEVFDWTAVNPHLGFAYSTEADRKELLRASYSRFADQLGTSAIAERLNPLSINYAYFYFPRNGDPQATSAIITSTELSNPSKSWVDTCSPDCATHKSYYRGPGRSMVFDMYGLGSGSADDGVFAQVVPATSGGGDRLEFFAASISGINLTFGKPTIVPTDPGRYLEGVDVRYNPVTDRAYVAFNECVDANRDDCPFFRVRRLSHNFKVEASVDLETQGTLDPGGTALAISPTTGNVLAQFEARSFAEREIGGALFDPNLNLIGDPDFFFPYGAGTPSRAGSSQSIFQPAPDAFFLVGDEYDLPGSQRFIGRDLDAVQPIHPVGSTWGSPVNPRLPDVLGDGSGRAEGRFSGNSFFFEVPGTQQARVGGAATFGAGIFRRKLRFRQACPGGAKTLCLNDGRFRVDVTDVTPQGVIARADGVLLSNDTGYFRFFDPANVEVFVKVVDGCGTNDRYWVFAGGLTSVHTVVTVTDTETGEMLTFVNPQDSPFQPYQNINAFACNPSQAVTLSPDGDRLGAPAPALRSLPAESVAVAASPFTAASPEAFGASLPATTCSADATHLCLNQGRFRVSTKWRSGSGASGAGHAMPILPPGGAAPDTGYFWFFNADNIEMVLKVLKACSTNSRYWVFAGGLTDVEVTTTVTDTKTGTTKIYENPQGVAFVPLQRTNDFACP